MTNHQPEPWQRLSQQVKPELLGQDGRPHMTEAERQRLIAQHKDWLLFILLCGVFGIAIGVGLAALIVQFDVNGIGSLIARGTNAMAYKLLLAGGFAHTFGMVAMGIGILIRSQLSR